MAVAGSGDSRRLRRLRPAVGMFWRGYARLIIALRYPLLAAWIAAVAGALLYLPAMSGGDITAGSVAPRHSTAVRAEQQATRLFGLPLTAPAAVVQYDAHRFPLREQARAARRAVAVDRRPGAPIAGLAAAVPIANTRAVFPGSRERSTTIITFLYFRPGTQTAAEAAAAQQYARRFLGAPQDHLAGVTGLAPAEHAQGVLIQRYLPWVELATVLAIALIVGIYFRSPGAPLASLAGAATAYLLSVRVVAFAAHRAHVSLPPDVKPLLVVLLLGVTTDYSVFFLAGMRSRLAQGIPRVAAARGTTAEFAPIVVTAGLVVSGGIATLALAQLHLLREFGPALALTVLISLVVAVTLAPALIGVFGRLLFLPGPAWMRQATAAAGEGAPEGRGAPGGQAPPGRARPAAVPVRTWREAAARLATARPTAILIALACLAGLAAATVGLRHMRLEYPVVSALPGKSEAARAAAAAGTGFAPGILSPTEILVLGPGVGRQRPALGRLQRALARRPGVAGVLGPADVPLAQRFAPLAVARPGNAARYGIIERADPLGPAAISRVQALGRDLPAMGRAAGLTGVRFEVGGATALAAESIDTTQADLGRIALAIGVVILVLLALFLRALIAPCYLLAASALAVLSALGLTAWVFQGLDGYQGFAYYVPFVAAVLLVSLGSDYNVFVTGRIWEEARRRPLRDAVALAAPRASRAITTAGLALAAGFALLALVPLAQFRELAVAMVAGIVIDAFIVRTFLVPALVVLFGRVGRWPGGRRADLPAGGQRPAPVPSGQPAGPGT